MNLNQYLSQDGIVARQFADDLGVPAPLISQWRTNERPIPIERCVAIERATSGAVTRQDLRPNDWESIWPELAEKAA